jgi:flavin reductase (DIM6/NTAB) family NADH-FMN oxidoreductase RutF
MPTPPLTFDFAQLAPRERYKLLIGIVVPRPIALITSLNDAGRVNAAPFSFFNVFSEDPAQIVLGLQHKTDRTQKDTTRNLRPLQHFVVNMVDEALAATMSDCAIDFPPDVSEIEVLGIATEPGVYGPAPRIAAAPIVLECRASVSLAFSAAREILIGEVLGAVARGDLVDRRTLHVNPERYRPIGRLAGNMYCRQGDLFELSRPSFQEWSRSRGKKAER